MKKKIIGILIILLVTATGCEKKEQEVEKPKKIENIENTYVLDYEEYRKITLDNIISIGVLNNSEDGMKKETYTKKEDIEGIYDYWKEQKIGQEIPQRCDDNTTIYTFELKDKSKVSIEKECDWIIINEKSYDLMETVK